MADEIDTSAFIGVDPLYQNYASEHFQPMFSEDDDVRKQEESAKKTEEDSVVDPKRKSDDEVVAKALDKPEEVGPAGTKPPETSDEQVGGPRASARKTAQREEKK